jgi:hypothetical protein
MGAKQAFPALRYPEQANRLEIACQILNPDADPESLQALLWEYRDMMDYVLVTPITSYLAPKLEQAMPEALIYERAGFSIYALDQLDGE